MNYKIFKNILNEKDIEEIITHIDSCNIHTGKVGNRVNLNQKIRSDVYINNDNMLSKIDNLMYNNLYTEIQKDFGINTKFREKWKIGIYDGSNKGFYNLHTDTAGDTKYRKISTVIALSNPNDYEGGQFHFPKFFHLLPTIWIEKYRYK